MALDAGMFTFLVPATTSGTSENTISLVTPADVGFIVVPFNYDIAEIGFYGVGTAWTVTPPAVTFTKRPRPSSTSGEVTIGIVTCPAFASLPTTLGGVGIGHTIRKYLPAAYGGGTGTSTTAVTQYVGQSPSAAYGPGRIQKGQIIKVTVSTGATAGTGVAYVKGYVCGESQAEQAWNNAVPQVLYTVDVASTT